ncbi:MAG: hypothetical protein WD534_11365 [Phycisphaeraceae bacterium]
MAHAVRLLLLLSAVVMALALSLGCEMETRVVREPWWNQLPADPKPGDGGAGPRHAGGAWAIPLQRFTGGDRQQQARALIAEVQKATAVRNLWTEDVDGTATVYRGRYNDPLSEEVRQALQHTRQIRLGDDQPFASARISNLRADGEQRPTDPYDLRQFPGFYTLQIGFYDAQYGDDFRDAAEQAVDQLREDEHEAYYYHGPHRSLITIGLFSYNEAFVTADDPVARRAQVDAYAPSIRELQDEFPYNLGNGLTRVDYDSDGEKLGEQRSFLVRVF